MRAVQIEAGADFVVTQLFYDVDRYLQFVKDCRCGAPLLREADGCEKRAAAAPTRACCCRVALPARGRPSAAQAYRGGGHAACPAAAAVPAAGAVTGPCPRRFSPLPRRSVGIGCPILPGVMPVMTYGGFKRMTSFCKTAVPQHIADTLEAIKDNEAAVKVRRGWDGEPGGGQAAARGCGSLGGGRPGRLAGGGGADEAGGGGAGGGWRH